MHISFSNDCTFRFADYSIDDNNYSVPVTIKATYNSNYYTLHNLVANTLKSLSLSATEIDAYKKTNFEVNEIQPFKELDPAIFLNGILKNDVYSLRSQQRLLNTVSHCICKSLLENLYSYRIDQLSSESVINSYYNRIDEYSNLMSLSCGTTEDNIYKTTGFSVTPDLTVSQEIEIEPVDLGLSVKWGSCDLGETKICRSFFAFGDVTGQICRGSKWSGDGFVSSPNYELDANGNLKPEYDAAHVNMGGNWRMPTDAECRELISNCTSTWTSDYNGTGVAGCILTSKKEGYTEKSIFLPSAGYGADNLHYLVGTKGGYWSSTFSSRNRQALYLDSNYHYDYNSVSLSAHHIGRSVRPVTE